MKKLLLILTAALLVSCSTEDSNESKSKSSDVLGTWKIKFTYNLSYYNGYSSRETYELNDVEISKGSENDSPFQYIGDYGIVEGEYFEKDDPHDVSISDTYIEWTFQESLFVEKEYYGDGSLVREPYETDHISISDGYHDGDKVYTSIGLKHGSYVVVYQDSDNLHLFYNSYWSEPRSKFIFLERVKN